MTPEEKELIRPSRVTLGNLLLASLQRDLLGERLADGLFDEVLEAYEYYSAASTILLASGMTMDQLGLMEKKLEALHMVEKLREALKAL